MTDLHPSTPLYSIEPLSIRALVRLGNDGLALILQWEEATLPTGPGGSFPTDEEGEGDRAGWKFLSLDLYTPNDPLWVGSVQEALERAAKKAEGSGKGRANMSIATPKLPPKSREDMAEGEGTTPGAYGAAEDFWEGWGDDGEEGDGAEVSVVEVQTEEETERYWDSYGEVDTQVGGEEDDQDDAEDEPEAAPRPRSVTRSRRSSTIRAPVSPSFALASPSYFAAAQSSNTNGTSTPTSSKDLPTPPPSDSRLAAPLPPAPAHSTTLLFNPDLAKNASSLHSSAAGDVKEISPPAHSHTLLFNPDDKKNALPAAPNGDHALLAHSSTLLFNPDSNKNHALRTSANSSGSPVAAPSAESTAESREEESLRFALAGVWQLYAGGAGGSKEKQERWLRIASQVTQA